MTRTRILLAAKCILTKIQERKIKKDSVMYYLQRRSDALIFFVITGVLFLVSDQVISGVSILSYMCRFFLLSISLIWYLNYSPQGNKGAFRGGRPTPFMRHNVHIKEERYR